MASLYNIGESTLETLPGTLTPPSAKYSPYKRLTDDCISVTSTPKSSVSSNSVIDLELVRGFNLGLIKMKNLNVDKNKKLNLLSNNRKRVNFEDDPTIEKKSCLGINKRSHYKLIKNRQQLYKFYKFIKSKKFKYVDNLWTLDSKHKRKSNKRGNAGDLI